MTRLTNAQRVESRFRRSVLAALSQQPMTADQLGRRLDTSTGRVRSVLGQLENDGHVGRDDRPQYPGGPMVGVWCVAKGGPA